MLQRSRCVFAAEGVLRRGGEQLQRHASTKPLRVRSGRVRRGKRFPLLVAASTKPLRVRSGREAKDGDNEATKMLQRSRRVFAAEGTSDSTTKTRIPIFNEAAACSQRKVHGVIIRQAGPRSFNEAAACSQRKEHQPGVCRADHRASTKPLRVRSGRREQSPFGRPEPLASTKPLRVRSGRFLTPNLPTRWRSGFNEAAACSQRKAGATAPTIVINNLLQRSRCVSAAEGAIAPASPCATKSLQRSRCVFAAEGAVSRRKDGRPNRASTKPLRVRSGRDARHDGEVACFKRFNEAAACSQRKAHAVAVDAGVRKRFNEAAACSQRKAPTCAHANAKSVVRFNEAAACSQRKGWRSSATSPPLCCFNEAAACSQRKAEVMHGELAVRQASTKPLRVRSGRTAGPPPQSSSARLQRSRCVFAAEGLWQPSGAEFDAFASTKPLRVRSGRGSRRSAMAGDC